MALSKLFAEKGLVVTSELGPPKGTNMGPFLKQAGYLRGWVDAANVTDGQAGMMKLGSLAACHLLKDFGVEPVMQITCRDRNRIALQSDLLSAGALGIENVLALTGDPVTIGDHPEAKPVFDLDAAQLLSVMRSLKSGKDMTDHALDGAPGLCIGAAMNPCASDLDVEISKTRKKIESGAEFFQTQGVFDPQLFDKFIRRYKSEGFTVPILAGIILVKSVKMARFMNEKIPGIVIPEALIRRFEGAQDAKRTCKEVAVELITALAPQAQGFHIMAIGWEELVPDIVQASRLRPAR